MCSAALPRSAPTLSRTAAKQEKEASSRTGPGLRDVPAKINFLRLSLCLRPLQGLYPVTQPVRSRELRAYAAQYIVHQTVECVAQLLPHAAPGRC